MLTTTPSFQHLLAANQFPKRIQKRHKRPVVTPGSVKKEKSRSSRPLGALLAARPVTAAFNFLSASSLSSSINVASSCSPKMSPKWSLPSYRTLGQDGTCPSISRKSWYPNLEEHFMAWVSTAGFEGSGLSALPSAQLRDTQLRFCHPSNKVIRTKYHETSCKPAT